MKFINFKAKVILLSIIPMLVISVLLTLLSAYYTRELWDKNSDAFVDYLYEYRREQLRENTMMAMSAIEHLYHNPHIKRATAQREALKILRNLRYGDDGYFFVYDYDGNNLVHPIKPYLEGKNLISLQDRDGVYIIQSLIRQAKNDLGGYSGYLWHKPSLGRDIDQLSFSMGLRKWKWMIGTSVYKDDIVKALNDAEKSVATNTREVVRTILIISLVLTAVVALIAIRFTVSQRRLASQKLQRLSRVCVEERENERGRVANQLSAEIARRLSISIKHLKEVISNLPYRENETKNQCLAIGDYLKKTQQQVSELADELRPQVLVTDGVYPAMENLANSLEKSHDIKIKVTMVDRYDRPSFDIEMACYYIAREALDNVIEHSQATEVNVRLRQAHNLMNMTIQDNGVGFEPYEKMGSGREPSAGLAGMQLRTELLNGIFTLFSSEGTGTIIKVIIPLS